MWKGKCGDKEITVDMQSRQEAFGSEAWARQSDRTVCGRESGKRDIVQAVWVGQHSGAARSEWTGGPSQTHVHTTAHFPIGPRSRVLLIALFLRVPYWGKRHIPLRARGPRRWGLGGVVLARSGTSDHELQRR